MSGKVQTTDTQAAHRHSHRSLIIGTVLPTTHHGNRQISDVFDAATTEEGQAQASVAPRQLSRVPGSRDFLDTTDIDELSVASPHRFLVVKVAKGHGKLFL